MFRALLFLLLFPPFLGKGMLAKQHSMWFTGFHYDAPLLLSKPEAYWKIRINHCFGIKKFFALIDLANHHWLKRSFNRCDSTIEIAGNYAKEYLSSLTRDTLIIQTAHFRWERALFAGKWKLALYRAAQMKNLPENPLKDILITYQQFITMAKGDVVFIEADNPILKKLTSDLVRIGYIRMAITMAILQRRINPNNLSDINYIMQILPKELNGYMLIHEHYSELNLEKDKLLKIIPHIDTNDYVSLFKVEVELARFYAREKNTEEFLKHIYTTKKLTTYLADVDVDNHYTGVIKEVKRSGLISDDIYSKLRLTNTYEWKQEVRRMLYFSYNNKRIKAVNDEYIEQIRKNKQLLILLSFILIALAVTSLYLVKSFKEIKQLNTYRHHFLHVLSHDLNATLLSLEQNVNSGNINFNKTLLMEHRMILDDTLQWAYYAQESKRITKEMCSLSDLMHEVVEQMQGLIIQKKIIVKWLNDEDAEVVLNKNAMLVTLRNMILNAVKHNTISGYIHIHVYANRVCIANSTGQKQHLQTGTGSFLINHFTKINNATYTLKVQDGVAQSEITLSNIKG
jgi:hypothetical protein